MKIQLDTTKKTIKLDENVSLSKFMSVIKRLLPNGEWMDFTLETNTTIEHWSSPTIYKFYEPYYTYPWFSSGPYYSGTGTLTSTNAINTLNTGNSLSMNASMGGNLSSDGNSKLNAMDMSASSNILNATLKDGIYNVQV